MRDSTEPYCLSALEPRVIRGGTMRPENSSKLWLNTFCEWSRVSTLWSNVTPLRPALIAFWEIPLDAASVLNVDSQESKLPVPQGAAASEEVAGSISVAPTAKLLDTASRSRRKVLEITRENPIREISSCSAKCFRQPRPKHGCFLNGEPPALPAVRFSQSIVTYFHGNRLAGKSA